MLSQNPAIAEDEPVGEKSIDEIVVVVDRAGNRVDIDAIKLDQIRDKIIREFELEQADQEGGLDIDAAAIGGSGIRAELGTIRQVYGIGGLDDDAARITGSGAGGGDDRAIVQSKLMDS